MWPVNLQRCNNKGRTDMGYEERVFTYDNIKLVLNAMFPGKIPANFTMSSSKLSYLISDGTGPYLIH